MTGDAVMRTEKHIRKLAVSHLRNSSINYLEDVISHGIHNITNEFRRMAESAEEYDLMHRVFSHEAFIMREDLKGYQ